MPFTLTMPKLSPTMEAGTLLKWRKKVGEHFQVGDVLFEVATDKATVEHSSLDEGYLRKILIEEGQEAVINQPMAICTETKDESIAGYEPEGVKPPTEKPEEPKEEKIEEEKPKAPVAAKPSSGALQQPKFVPEPPLEAYEFAAPSEKLRASPLARKLAKEKGLDLTTVKGTGPHHRIMSRDLDLSQPKARVTFGAREIPSIPPGTYEEEALTPMRKIIGQRLQESKTFIPHFYVTQAVDAERMVALRQELKNMGLSVSFNDLVVRATALALRVHPGINSGFNSVNQTIIRFKTIDISIAVSIESGLITPIVRYADYKNLGQLAVEVKYLAQKARLGKLEREEYMGGSFTISNLGMYGISAFVGVINPPQAALLAVAGIEECAVVKDGMLAPGKRMNLTLSADHRVIDGAEAAKFLKELQQILENPSILLI
jgi:pyruvate dehydrogenase E2 component (dihydrolipoamide acetyltransferase)